MPTSGEPEERLLDTSVAVALLVSDHARHRATMDALSGRRLGLAGHAAFETFSVLSRLPAPARRTPAAIGRMMAANFPATRFLSTRATRSLLSRLAPAGIAGGSVYDALIGAVAAEHDLTLVTRDRRAVPTYRALDVRVEVLE
ncbi:MAG: type II toxin-antitoxin system VapC family toxin [Acidimicrobiales bacterium]